LRHVDASVREPPRERGTARVFGRGAVTRSPDASSPTRLDQSWSAAARTVRGPSSPACRRTSSFLPATAGESSIEVSETPFGPL